MRDAARKKLAVSKIQKFGRYVLQSKQDRKIKDLKKILDRIFEEAWDIIILKKAVIIQSTYRGNKVRKQNK